MTWIKSNIWIVVLSIVSVLVYPIAWKFSSGMNKQIKESLEQKVKSAYTSVDQKVSYTSIQVDPNTPAVETLAVAPNAVYTEFYTELRKKQQAQLDEIITMADDFNRRDRKPLIEGLFPEPAGDTGTLAKIAMNKRFVFGPTYPPSAYEELFESINAGPPVDPLILGDELADKQQQWTAAREAAEGKVMASLEAKAESEKQLIDFRLASYRRRAMDISVYADMNCLPDTEGTERPRVFDRPTRQPPVTWQCYLWQHDYWTLMDVIDAIGRANTDENGDFTAVPESPVKRIIKLEMANPLVPLQSIKGDLDPNAGTITSAGARAIAPDFAYGVSGRFSSPDNRLYDVRIVTLEAIVAMEKLPQFFDAMTETNFITVTDLQLKSVSVAKEISTGFYYGSDYVVQANMKLEVLLLRSWTEQYMPDGIKYRLGNPPLDQGMGGDGFDDDGFSNDGGG